MTTDTLLVNPSHTCQLCGQKPAAMNGYVCDQCFDKSSFPDGVDVILLGADGKKEYGIVVLSPLGIVNSPHNELVGHWSMCPDGNTWVRLVKTADALHDRATLVMAELTQRRLLGLKPVLPSASESRPRRTSTRSVTRAPEAQPGHENMKQIEDKFAALRNKLRRQI